MLAGGRVERIHRIVPTIPPVVDAEGSYQVGGMSPAGPTVPFLGCPD